VAPRAPTAQEKQLALFGARHPLVERLAAIDVNALTPMQAMALLEELNRGAKSE